MGEQHSITFKQLNQLILTLALATKILYLPATTMKEAGNGGWLSPILSILPSIAIVTAVYILNKRYPDKTIIQYLPDLLGTFSGKIVGFVMALFFWGDGAATERELAEFIHGFGQPDAPVLAVDVILFGLLAYALYCGLEGLARVNELTYMTIIFLYLILILGIFGSFHANAFYPLLDKGLSGVIRGAFVPGSWSAEVILIALFLPHVEGEQHRLGKLILVLVLIGILLMFSNAITIAVLGAPEAARSTLPTLEVVRYIQWGDFFQHIETLFILPWLMVMLVKTTIHLFGGLIAMAQVLNVSNQQFLIIPLCLLSIVLNRWVFPTEIDLSDLLFVLYPLVSYVVQLMIPVLLLLLSMVRNRPVKRGSGS